MDSLSEQLTLLSNFFEVAASQTINLRVQICLASVRRRMLRTLSTKRQQARNGFFHVIDVGHLDGFAGERQTGRTFLHAASVALSSSMSRDRASKAGAPEQPAHRW